MKILVRELDLSLMSGDLAGAALDIARLVRDAGGRALMVGGAVRDMVSGKEANDADIEVFGLPPDLLVKTVSAKYDLDLVGLSFGVLKLHHLDIDISTPRRETKRGTGHKGFEIDSDPSLRVEEAAARRDFTVNAIYYDPLAKELIDPFGGLDDLANGVMRHVSSKFAEDPLRVLRGMQFVARFGYCAAPETIALCRTIDPEGLPPERQFEEWRKLLVKGKSISDGLEFLRATGWVAHYPELARLIGCGQDPKWHPEGDVWTHTLMCLDAFARRRTGGEDEDLVVGLAVLCHDFGKPATTLLERGRLRSPGHDAEGVAPTLSFLRRLTNEERLLRDVPPLVACHMQPFALWRGNAGDSAVRRLAAKVGRIDRLVRVARADAEGCGTDRSQDPGPCDALEWLSSAAERLRVADEAPQPILRGRDLIALGYKPCKDFGEWLGACFEAQLDGEFSDLPGAIDYFKSWMLVHVRK